MTARKRGKTVPGSSTLAPSDDTRRPSPAATSDGRLLTDDEVATLCDRTPAQMLALLREYERWVCATGKARSYHVPRDPDRFPSWGMRMGWVRLDGHAVIGYTGMQFLFDLDSEQTVRKWALAEGFPSAVAFVGPFALFDRAEVIEFGKQSGRLGPDGSARRLRDRRP